MFNVRVEKRLDKNINDVFDVLADHEGYTAFPGVKRSVLLEHGTEEKNGVGALREVELGPATFKERITEFDRPNRMCYHIESSKPLPMHHDKGEITLTPDGDGTKVVWISEGHINLPLLGSLIFDGMVQKQGASGFGAVLSTIDKMP